MNIYLVERTDSWSYDDYEAFVCKASSEEQAKRIHPEEYYIWKDNNWYFRYSDGSTEGEPGAGSWVKDITNLKVKEIGVANDNEPGLVLVSFHAG